MDFADFENRLRLLWTSFDQQKHAEFKADLRNSSLSADETARLIDTRPPGLTADTRDVADELERFLDRLRQDRLAASGSSSSSSSSPRAELADTKRPKHLVGIAAIVLVAVVVVVGLVRDKDIAIETPAVSVTTTSPARDLVPEQPADVGHEAAAERISEMERAVNRLSEGTIREHRIADQSGGPGRLLMFGRGNEFRLEYEFFPGNAQEASYLLAFPDKITARQIAAAYIRQESVMDLADWQSP